MALRPVVVVGDSDVVLSLDVDASDQVVAVECANNTSGPVTVEVVRPQGNRVLSVQVPPGVTRQGFPRARRFRFADELLADWSASVTVRWRR